MVYFACLGGVVYECWYKGQRSQFRDGQNEGVDSDICWIPMKAGAQGVKTGQRFVYYYFCSFKLAGVTNYFY